MGHSTVRVKLYGFKVRKDLAEQYIKETENKFIENEYTLDYHVFIIDSIRYYLIEVCPSFARKQYYLCLKRPEQKITSGRGYRKRTDSELDSDSDCEDPIPKPEDFPGYNPVKALALKLGARPKDAKVYSESVLT